MSIGEYPTLSPQSTVVALLQDFRRGLAEDPDPRQLALIDACVAKISTKLYLNSGLSLAAIARSVGISKTTLSDRFQRAGIKLRTGPETRCFGAPTPELARLYLKEDLPPAQIANRLGITKSAVLSRLIRAGCQLRPRGGVRGRFKVPGVKTEALVKAFQVDHQNYSQIAERFGISRPAVVNRLKQAGCALPKRKYRVELSEEEVVKLYTDEKLSLEAIAEQFDVGQTTIRRILAKRGIKLRHRAGHMKAWHAERKQTLEKAKQILATRGGADEKDKTDRRFYDFGLSVEQERSIFKQIYKIPPQERTRRNLQAAKFLPGHVEIALVSKTEVVAARRFVAERASPPKTYRTVAEYHRQYLAYLAAKLPKVEVAS